MHRFAYSFCLDIDVAIAPKRGAGFPRSGVDLGPFLHRPGHVKDVDALLDVRGDQVGVSLDGLRPGQISSAGDRPVGRTRRDGLRRLVRNGSGNLCATSVVGSIS